MNVKHIAEIDAEISDLEYRIKDLKLERARLEEQAIDYLLDMGVDSMRVDLPTGKRTLYLKEEIWASATEPDALAHNLDTADMVRPTVNGQTLSAWVREQPRDPEGNPILPESIKDAIKISRVTKLRTRKA